MNRLFSFIGLAIALLFLSISASASELGNNKDPEPTYAHSLCENPALRCVTVSPRETWTKLFPNPQVRDLVQKLNRTNVPLYVRKWIIIPRDLKDLKSMEFSPFPPQIKPPGHKLLVVNLSEFAFAAYNRHGELMRWGPATGGREWCDDLNKSCASAIGQYRIYRKQGAECVSSTFPLETEGGAPMPWCMHYYKGFAIHGSTLSGFVNRSRGCIRLFDEDAEWLNRHFVRIGTEVIVRR